MFGLPFVVSFIVGPFVDRWNKAVILRIACFVKLGVTGMILTTHILSMHSPWVFFLGILAFCSATLFSGPAYTAVLPRVVNSEDLVKANVLMNMTGILGGLGIGVVLYMIMAGGGDFAVVYWVNAVVLALGLLFAFLIASEESSKKREKAALKSYLGELKEGFLFVKKGVMLPLIIALIFMNFFADVAYVNLPMFAEVHLGTASGYILLSAFALMGGLIGSYIARSVEEKYEVWKIMVGAFVFAGVARILFVNVLPVNRSYGIIMFLIYVGIGSTIGIFYQSLIQKLPPKDLISRVDTIITSLCSVAAAVGALVGGLLGTILTTVDMVFMIQGGSYIIIGLCLCLPKIVRAMPKIGEIGKEHDVAPDDELGL